ncbi:ShlB/FhaC/HecB family hemolysin secretion/activation protein [Dyella acidiphila]|uniref:ShlB/FhaC/HecB family hemolysin secretion/activation protein n=1 Tax=Dyella acidiphila TaxID=2775866 RepID=A0ABR9GB71_9GAMM|nr:ShlB/FhaC/HecB family hemolysin secretion/activation protein [Dyella acidiphila]MBE1161323.1 ShlB/FhaC/HecB family hemolysin secretion/activation protein [Dyella acidiphila]
MGVQRLAAPRYAGLALAVAYGLAQAGTAHAQTAQPGQEGQEAQRRLSRELERVQDAVADKQHMLKRSRKQKEGAFQPPAETSCFAVNDVRWTGSEPFLWLPGTVSLRGMCLGHEGLQALQRYLTGQLIQRGYVTSMAIIPQQSLADGMLTIQVIPGRIGKFIDKATGEALRARNALPVREGDVLNVRDLDQALENIRRVPGQATAKFTLTPGDEPGTSDITLDRQRGKSPWHVLFTADNSGLDATGQNQLGVIAVLDSPLQRDDLLLLTYSNNMNIGNARQASRAVGTSWSLPVGYWNFSLNANSSYFKQTFDLVGGGHIAYTGYTTMAQVGADRVLHRTQRSRSTVKLQLNRRKDSNFLGNERLGVQQRDITGFGASYDYLHYVGQSTLHGTVGVRGSMPGLSSVPGYVAGSSHWNGSYRVGTANVDVNVPFAIGKQGFSYEGNLYGQHAFTPLPWTEYLSVNSRYAVRGFDGRYVFTAENGWVSHNNIVWNSGGKLGNPYVGVDAAKLSGPSLRPGGSQHFSSVSLGLRGSVARLSYDLSVGQALNKPKAVPNGGFNVSLQMVARF